MFVMTTRSPRFVWRINRKLDILLIFFHIFQNYQNSCKVLFLIPWNDNVNEMIYNVEKMGNT